MSTRVIAGAVGAVIGYIAGGPQGAYYGWTIGSTFGALADPGVIRGPSIQDLAQQQSQEGGPRPIVFARSPPMAGNVIVSTPTKKIKRRKSQGKGGPKVQYETIHRTYAIGVCEGPIDRFVRIWRNGELVYSDLTADELNFYETPENATAEDRVKWAIRIALNNVEFINRVTLYTGTYEQNPNPTLEQIFGVGTTPAHRGTAYMVVVDDDLTDFRGAIPQFMFQVEKRIEGEDRIVYLQGEHVWDKPEGLNYIDVRAIAPGGGGSSGGGQGNAAGGGGGGGGYAAGRIMAEDLPDTVDVVVGEFGEGGASVTATPIGDNGRIGEKGGDASFGEFLFAEGGEGGRAYTGSGASEAPGGDASVSAEVLLAVTEQGGSSYKESPTPPGDTDHAGAGGGYTDAIPGGTCSDEGDYTGGDGGLGGVSSAIGNGSPGLPGQSYGGGGGAGGAAILAGFMTGPGGDGGPGVVIVDHVYHDEGRTGIQSIVRDICVRAGLPEEKIDVSMLFGRVYGYAIVNSYPAIEALRALSQIFMFDAVSQDGKVVFVPRGRDTVATITEDEMVDTQDDSDEIDQKKRADSISIPRVMNLNYYDVAGNLNTDKQTSERSGDRRAVGEIQLQSPVLMTSSQAKRALIINHKVYTEDQKGELRFMLPDKFIRLSPADAIFLQWQGRTERVRLARVDTQDGYQEYIGVIDRQTAYQSRAEGYPASPSIVPANNVPGPTLIRPLDIPLLHDQDDALGFSFYIAISGASEAWNGATIEISYDGGQNYVESRDAHIPVTMGLTTTVLADHPAEWPDYTNTVRVNVQTPDVELDSTDFAGVLNNVNLCMIGDEMLQFMDAEEVDDGVWELSGLIRGRKHTVTTSHAIGEAFVMLDELVAFPLSITDVGRTITFRATSFGTDTSTGTVVSMTYQGICQREFPVGYLSAHRDGTDAIVSWQGIGRLGSGSSVAHGARFAGYRVTFSDIDSPPGAPDVVIETDSRSISQDVSSFPGPVRISVVQLNDLTGAGPSTEITLP